eukprot:CAMPEP_0184862016 /NCGR_PEP_ID=MMETSP0580-20130426/6560_1 /TAXON_ID=1118495 /ORGANISM="Dactyliosolen fragilissimus" /LENGTH=123 /DNA_ID=CAMNT_0027359715 /DNA_START=161 /DNA_END=532 /DNA_ORIENTATION=+
MDEVSKHNTDKDCWLVIGNEKTGGPKVYDVTSYLDDHPGGAEVLLDVAGQDADEFFEDIGHSKDAREELKSHLVGTLKLDPEEIARRKAAAEAQAAGNGGGISVIMILVAFIAIAFGLYKTQM